MPTHKDNVVLLFNKTPDDWKELFQSFFKSGGAVVVIVG